MRAIACAALLLAALGNVITTSAGPDTWAVILSSSRYWHNYRHTSNSLGVYQAVKRLGLPDDRILLMLADNVACNARNAAPGTVRSSPGGRAPDVYAGAEVDYRGRDVSVDSLLNLLTDQHPAGTPASRRLRSGRGSSVLLFMTGHGGDEFLKFHDQQELLAADLAHAVHAMHALGRYGHLLIMVDTCQAGTLLGRITAPNVLGFASSKLGQSSYALHLDPNLGVHIVDEASHDLATYLDALDPASIASSNASIPDLFAWLGEQLASSAPALWASAQQSAPLCSLRVADFFAGAGPPEEQGKPAPEAATAAAAVAAAAAAGAAAGAEEWPDSQGASGAPAPLDDSAAAACTVQQQGAGKEGRHSPGATTLEQLLLNAASWDRL